MSSEGRPAIGSLLDAATERLRAAGVTKPRREANRLWAWQHRVAPGQAVLDRDHGADPAAGQRFDDAVRRRIAGEPIAYVLGWAGFRHLELVADRRALIPRPETELLVEHALRLVRTGRALDLCTGSGCLALALAQEGSFDQVTGSDLSREALSLAATNARITGRSLRLVQSDLGAAFRAERFDVIVANPPYLTVAEFEALDASVREWEPRLALASGPDGLEASRGIVTQAATLLVPGGWLVMELDSTRGRRTAELARDAGLAQITVLEDLFGRERYLIARRGHDA